MVQSYGSKFSWCVWICIHMHRHAHARTHARSIFVFVYVPQYIYIYIYRERERAKDRERERESSVCVCVRARACVYIHNAYGCMHTHNLQEYCMLLTALSGRDSFNNRSPRMSLQYLASLYCCPLQQWFSNERMTGKSEVTKAVSRRA
jgi:hypothetical protein